MDLRREFTVDVPVDSPSVRDRALGAYEARLNGERRRRAPSRPGTPSSPRRVHAQTYDVTTQIRRGENVLGPTVADGWYASWRAATAGARRPAVRSLSSSGTPSRTAPVG